MKTTSAEVSGLPIETVRRTRGFLRNEYNKGMGAARGAVRDVSQINGKRGGA